LSILNDVRKNGRMVSPEAVARRPMKAVKSITVTAVPQGMERRMSWLEFLGWNFLALA
jgi:hypothetical protein